MATEKSITLYYLDHESENIEVAATKKVELPVRELMSQMYANYGEGNMSYYLYDFISKTLTTVWIRIESQDKFDMCLYNLNAIYNALDVRMYDRRFLVMGITRESFKREIVREHGRRPCGISVDPDVMFDDDPQYFFFEVDAGTPMGEWVDDPGENILGR